MSTISTFGVVASYLHHDAQVGALVEVACDTKIATLSHELRTFAHELAMHVAAADPQALCSHDLTDAARDAATRRLLEDQVRAGRSEMQARRIVTAREESYREQMCLLDQRFACDPTVTVRERLNTLSECLHERLEVVRFVRFAAGHARGAAGALMASQDGSPAKHAGSAASETTCAGGASL